jgi:hypothetical protein
LKQFGALWYVLAPNGNAIITAAARTAAGSPPPVVY